MTLTIETDSTGVIVTARGPLRHLCPVVEEIDEGRVAITWRTHGVTFELHALAAHLRSYAGTRISHEDLTDTIRHDLSAHAGLTLLDVTTTWETAGLEVSCSTSPTPAGATP